MPTHLSQKVCAELAATAQQIATPGKGILATDEPIATLTRGLDVPNDDYLDDKLPSLRDYLYKTPELGKYISGAILYEETYFYVNDQGESLRDVLKAHNIVPGIKVDIDSVELPGSDMELSTCGIDGLGERCKFYHQNGVRFTKWLCKAAVDVVTGKPSSLAVIETAHSLARFAAISQENGLVPVLEAKVIGDGQHTIQEGAEALEKVLSAVFKALHDHHVLIEGCLLKCNMVTPGAECKEKASHSDIGFYTIRSLRRSVPPALPGIMFLSGGQPEEETSLNLSAINKEGQNKQPWILSFSFGRALQGSVLEAWQGREENIGEAQDALLARATINSEAQQGRYH